jgi:hypothetical protein
MIYKLLFPISFAFLMGISLLQGQIIRDIGKEVGTRMPGSKGGLSFSEEDAANALKEALSKGAISGVEWVSKLDGYLANPKIKIPFPPSAIRVEEKLRSIGMNKECDDVVVSINRAAEDAGSAAKDIFLSAIKNMTLKDAIGIVNGGNDAGTVYLKKNTGTDLTRRFRPIIEVSLDKVGATRYWDIVINAYNKIPLVQKANPDLPGYVTEKAIDGLFILIAEEELKIRKNPMARTSDLLKKVFGDK